ncbi:hypothetical protein [Neobacillus drentensis]|uniref:hypothetical protein n=1 Tax=Neobacillus drentensis TaxID=220684 RepID=UPI002FFE2FDA
MEKPEDFKKLALYSRSLDLHIAVNNFLRVYGATLNDTDQLNIRRLTTTVSRKIALAMGQTNIKICFKKLNEAKKSLLQLQSMLKEAVSRQERGNAEFLKIENYSIQVLKLFNYYFGQLKK